MNRDGRDSMSGVHANMGDISEFIVSILEPAFEGDLLGSPDNTDSLVSFKGHATVAVTVA